MKKRLGIVLGLSFLFISVAPALAEIRWGCEVHGLYSFNYDTELKADWQTWDEGNAAGGGASLVLDLFRNVKVDFGFDYLKADLKKTPEWLTSSETTLVPVSAALRVGAPLGLFFIYTGGGIGYSFNDVKSNYSSDIKVENCFTYFFLLGLEAAVGEMGSEKLFRETFENVALRGELRFNWMEPELKWFTTNLDWQYNYMQLRAGLVLYF